MTALAPKNKVLSDNLDEGNWRFVYRQLQPRILEHVVTNLNGLPYPVRFRNLNAIESWRDALNTTDAGRAMWRAWMQPELPNAACTADINFLLKGMVGPLADPHDALRWRTEAAHLSVQFGVNIGFELKQGSLIEPTPSLETLLLRSDLEQGLPMAMVSPPFNAHYVRFGADAARLLVPPQLAGVPRIVDGVFCFMSQKGASEGGSTLPRHLELTFICKSEDHYKGYITVRGPVDDAGCTIDQWIRQMVEGEQGTMLCGAEVELLIRMVNYVVKVFLYMGLKGIRIENYPRYREARDKIAGLGRKKRAKLLRHIGTFYDSIIVGPAGPPGACGEDGCGTAVAPHWRRGHFRLQTHGPGNRSRKLIFVLPVIVRSDLLNDEAPRPKNYRAVA